MTADGVAVLACCGFKDSGKTTLLEGVVPLLRARGISVAVVKHDAHGVHFDRPGKDSDRLFRAGADVVVRGADESAARWHPEGAPDLGQTLARLGASHDLVLVEGHKRTDLPKLWLLGEGETAPPGDVTEIRRVLPRDGDRVSMAVEEISRLLDKAWRTRPLLTGVLVGGGSTRMGSPKQLLDHRGRTLVHRAVDGLGCSAADPVLLGSGRVPDDLAGNRRLADVPGIAGPLSGLLAALRWAPTAAWLMVACDQPLISRHAVDWLLTQRRPGRWAILPRLGDGPVEPFLAVYEPQALILLERLARSGALGPWRIAGHEKVASPEPPAELAASWRNVNTPEDLDSLPG
jgi:molybdopterin-guanine dinucleotide biosynthesis protein MobB